MNKREAMEMLDMSPQTEKPSRLNPSITQKQGVEIVRNGLKDKPDDWKLGSLYEKRVWQMFKNQKRPRY